MILLVPIPTPSLPLNSLPVGNPVTVWKEGGRGGRGREGGREGRGREGGREEGGREESREREGGRKVGRGREGRKREGGRELENPTPLTSLNFSE